MPGWGDILAEIQESALKRGPDGPDLDGIRLKYIRKLNDLTGRPVIVYASGWLSSSGVDNIDFTVRSSDVIGFMESCHHVRERELDLIIHSPGGSGTAAEQIMNYLRTQFDHIRAFVPLQAKSAATMMALGSDEIVLGAHSELGPIDPQIPVPTPGGHRFAPAHAILRDFRRAKQEIGDDVTALPVWTPILHAYAGGLLTFCEQQIELSQDVVAGWLQRYMLAHPESGIAEAERESRALGIAEWFGSDKSYDRFREHARPIRIDDLQAPELGGLRITRLEDDNNIQDTVLSISHSLDFTFGGPASKIIENHLGKRYVKIQQQLIIQGGPQPIPPVPEPQTPPRPEDAPGSPNGPNRSERRRMERNQRKR